MEINFIFSRSVKEQEDDGDFPWSFLEASQGKLEPLLLTWNSEYPNLIDVKGQTKRLTTEEIIKLFLKSNHRFFDNVKWENQQNECDDSPIEDFVNIKTKNSHWTNLLKLTILRKYYIDKQTKSEISKYLLIPYSTVSRTICESQIDYLSKIQFYEWEQMREAINKRTTKHIQKYIEAQRSTFNSKDICEYIKMEYDVLLPKRIIIDYLKKNLNLSFKRVSLRPVLKDFSKIDALKWLFAVEITNIIDNSKILVNIDEATFGRSTKSNYSWTKRGANWSSSNISFSSSFSLIWAITSLGNWWASHLESTNNSTTFIEFLDNCLKWLRVDLQIDMRKIVIVLDNWAIHRSKKVMSYLNKFGWIIIYAPPYTPEFWAVELFFNVLKRRIVTHWKKRNFKAKRRGWDKMNQRYSCDIQKSRNCIILD